MDCLNFPAITNFNMSAIRLKKVSLPLGEVSVSSAMAQDNAREKATTTKKKQPPPIAAFLAMDLNKSPSVKNAVNSL